MTFSRCSTHDIFIDQRQGPQPCTPPLYVGRLTTTHPSELLALVPKTVPEAPR